MEAEEKLEPVWVQNLRATLKGEVDFSHQMNSAILRAFNEQYENSSALLHAASLFIEEAERLGWGKTSETWLPPSFDNLKAAVEGAKR